MDIVTADNLPPLAYPYWKVVMIADRAEVAELPCEGSSSENIVHHADLLDRLLGRRPELESFTQAFTAGWLTRDGHEATLYIANKAEDTTLASLGQALTEWCTRTGIQQLSIAGSDATEATKTDPASDGWSLPL